MSDYKDDDLVYIDPKNRKVIGVVEWQENGKPKKVEMTEPDDSIGHDDDEEEQKSKKTKKGRSRKKKKRYYPWMSYRTAKKMYKIEGKVREEEGNKEFDEVLALALDQPFWD